MADEGLTFGLALTSDPVRLRRAGATFAERLQEALGAPVRVSFVPHYDALHEALLSGDISAAWLPPLLACRALRAELIEPVALPVRAGSAAYFSAVFSAADSALRKPEDLRGVRAVWVDRSSAAGYVVPRAHLRSVGVELGAAFTDERFAGTHDQVAQAVLSGVADVGATFVSEDERGEVRAGWGRAPVTVIALAGPIPSDVLAMRADVDPLIVARTGEILTRELASAAWSAATSLFEAEAFLAPSPEHFETLSGLLDDIDADAGQPLALPRAR